MRLRIDDGAGVDDVKVGGIRDAGVQRASGLGGGDRCAEARIVEQFFELGARLALFLALDVEHADEGVGHAWIEQPLPVERHRVAGDDEVLIGLSDRKPQVVVGFRLQGLRHREVDDQVETSEDQNEQDEVLCRQARQGAPKHQPDSR